MRWVLHDLFTHFHSLNSVFIWADRGQSKTLVTIDERGSKITRNSVFNCHLSPVGWQMAIKNSVSNDFWSMFIHSINVFECDHVGEKQCGSWSTGFIRSFINTAWVIIHLGLYTYECTLLNKPHQRISALFGPRHEKLSSVVANNKGTDQPARLPSLISAFIICLLKSIII